MSYLAFVRHGLSQANIDNITAGHLDTPLHDIGRDQARQTAELIKHLRFQKAVGSPLKRAKETLGLILDELENPVTPTFHKELRERNWGDVDGTIFKSRANGKYTLEEEKNWFTWTGKADGGESYEDIHNRIVPFFEQHVLPVLKAGGNVLMVGHNGMSKPLQRYLEDLPYEFTTDLDLKNCEIKLYEFDESGSLKGVSSLHAGGQSSAPEK
ncbi:MAG: histidine phosphatase family protein [bacterium]|nr:histidine phosphatase family protein [bacterium]